jgi:hypothetical protein
MTSGSSGIAVGGRERLQTAIEEQVQREFQQELAAAQGHWERAAIKRKMAEEVKKRMNEVSSPQSLWGGG